MFYVKWGWVDCVRSSEIVEKCKANFDLLQIWYIFYWRCLEVAAPQVPHGCLTWYYNWLMSLDVSRTLMMCQYSGGSETQGVSRRVEWGLQDLRGRPGRGGHADRAGRCLREIRADQEHLACQGAAQLCLHRNAGELESLASVIIHCGLWLPSILQSVLNLTAVLTWYFN